MINCPFCSLSIHSSLYNTHLNIQCDGYQDVKRIESLWFETLRSFHLFSEETGKVLDKNRKFSSLKIAESIDDTVRGNLEEIIELGKKSLSSIISREAILAENELKEKQKEQLERKEAEWNEFMKQIWTDSFPFFDKNLVLTAWYNHKNNNTYFSLERVNPKTKKKEIIFKIEDLEPKLSSEARDFLLEKAKSKNKFNYSREFESLRRDSIKTLSHEELYFSLKSWVQGLAEAGFDSILIQYEFEDDWLEGTNSIAAALFYFLMKENDSFLDDYFNHLRDSCIQNGEMNLKELKLKIQKLLDMFTLDDNDWYFIDFLYNDDIFKNFDLILEKMIKIAPYADFYHGYKKYQFLLEDPRIQILGDWEDLQKGHSVIINGNRIWTFIDDIYGPEEEILFLIDLEIKDIREIQNLENLSTITVLCFYNCNLSNYENIPYLPNLKFVEIDEQKFKFPIRVGTFSTHT
jgi:hypothetical protein